MQAGTLKVKRALHKSLPYCLPGATFDVLASINADELMELQRPNMGVSENWGTFFWGPCNKDPTV